MKDACTGDIQEQDWEPLNRGIVLKRWKTALAALAIFCLLTGCGMMNHGDAESESPSPLEGPAATEGFTPAADSTWETCSVTLTRRGFPNFQRMFNLNLTAPC